MGLLSVCVRALQFVCMRPGVRERMRGRVGVVVGAGVSMRVCALTSECACTLWCVGVYGHVYSAFVTRRVCFLPLQTRSWTTTCWCAGTCRCPRTSRASAAPPSSLALSAPSSTAPSSCALLPYRCRSHTGRRDSGCAAAEGGVCAPRLVSTSFMLLLLVVARPPLTTPRMVNDHFPTWIPWILTVELARSPLID